MRFLSDKTFVKSQGRFVLEIRLVKERDNPFLKRKDLVLDIIHTSSPTPRAADLKKELADKYKVDVSQVVVEYIMTQAGLNKSTAKIKILEEKPPIMEEEPPTAVEAEEEKPAKKPLTAEEKKEEKIGEEIEAQASEAT